MKISSRLFTDLKLFYNYSHHRRSDYQRGQRFDETLFPELSRGYRFARRPRDSTLEPFGGNPQRRKPPFIRHSVSPLLKKKPPSFALVARSSEPSESPIKSSLLVPDIWYRKKKEKKKNINFKFWGLLAFYRRHFVSRGAGITERKEEQSSKELRTILVRMFNG